jgi:hypothetical protein
MQLSHPWYPIQVLVMQLSHPWWPVVESALRALGAVAHNQEAVEMLCHTPQSEKLSALFHCVSHTRPSVQLRSLHVIQVRVGSLLSEPKETVWYWNARVSVPSSAFGWRAKESYRPTYCKSSVGTTTPRTSQITNLASVLGLGVAGFRARSTQAHTDAVHGGTALQLMCRTYMCKWALCQVGLLSMEKVLRDEATLPETLAAALATLGVMVAGVKDGMAQLVERDTAETLLRLAVHTDSEVCALMS